jgi:serine/threonine protein kinase
VAIGPSQATGLSSLLASVIENVRSGAAAAGAALASAASAAHASAVSRLCVSSPCPASIRRLRLLLRRTIGAVVEVPGYRIEGVAGRGGWSVVYRAVQLSLERPVALKLIAPELAGDEGFRARFRRECAIAASIEHPGAIPVYDAGESDGLLYVAMRRVDGPSLRQVLPLPPERAAHVIAQVAGALDAAHDRGLVHRDVKPANVLLEGEARAFLTDFGLAKEISPDPGLTEAGRWLGSVGYAAPEQIRGRAPDARSDVYALGATLFHAVAGRLPFAAQSDAETMRAHLHAPPPAHDSPLDPVVRRAMAKDPAERYPSAGELGRAALEAVRR